MVEPWGSVGSGLLGGGGLGFKVGSCCDKFRTIFNTG